jgi:hypothetical protein
MTLIRYSHVVRPTHKMPRELGAVRNGRILALQLITVLSLLSHLEDVYLRLWPGLTPDDKSIPGTTDLY